MKLSGIVLWVIRMNPIEFWPIWARTCPGVPELAQIPCKHYNSVKNDVILMKLSGIVLCVIRMTPIEFGPIWTKLSRVLHWGGESSPQAEILDCPPPNLAVPPWNFTKRTMENNSLLFSRTIAFRSLEQYPIVLDQNCPPSPTQNPVENPAEGSCEALVCLIQEIFEERCLFFILIWLLSDFLTCVKNCF